MMLELLVTESLTHEPPHLLKVNLYLGGSLINLTRSEGADLISPCRYLLFGRWPRT
jgi:hypothetical protein